MNIAIITGASSGIGEQFLRQLVRERGFFGSIPFEEIWVVARRADRLLTLRSELDPVRIRVYTEDLTSPEALDAIRDELAARNPTIGLLVNCAGVGRTGRFETVSRDDIHRMISLNCSALAELTALCLPYMIPLGDHCSYAAGPRILNIASSSGFLPQPGFAVYAATKSFVIHFSRAIRAELRAHNIGVTTVCPGPVSTEFVGLASGTPGAGPKGIKAYFVVGPERLVAKSIAKAKAGRGVYVYGFSQKCLHAAAKLLPTHLMVSLVSGLSPDAKAPARIPAAAVLPVAPSGIPGSGVQASASGGSGHGAASPRAAAPVTSPDAERILAMYPRR